MKDIKKEAKERGIDLDKVDTYLKAVGRSEAVSPKSPPIRIWRFRDAPLSLKELSNHGGDEDWLALIPPKLADVYIPWLEENSQFGCCAVSTHELADGSVVKIGSH